MAKYILGSGTAICVNPHADHLYIVGTEEGKIYKCSKAYKDHYLNIYEVRGSTIFNFLLSCTSRHITWQYTHYDGVRIMPMCLHHVVLIGPSRYGIILESNLLLYDTL